MNLRRISLAAVVVSAWLTVGVSRVQGITIDGDFSDWIHVNPIARDKAEGTTPCDWRDAFATHDSLYWYVRYVCELAVDFDRGAAYNIYIDADRNRMTGFRGAADEFPLGAEYLVQGGQLFAYMGGGQNWLWEKKTILTYGVTGDSVELSVPRQAIGNPARIDFFLYGDNEAVQSGVGDLCPDGALTTGGTGALLRYSFQ